MSHQSLRRESFEQDALPRPATLWWSSPRELEERRGSFVIAAPALDVTRGVTLGHAVGLILQDAVARYRVAQGWDVSVAPWLDHDGLFPQYIADLDVSSRTGDRNERGEFDRLSRKWQHERRRRLTTVLRQLGVGEPPPESSEVAQERAALGAQLFEELYRRGWVYRDRVLANHCDRCGRAVGEPELRIERVKATARVLRAQVDGFGAIEIATLHPELLLNAVGVAATAADLRSLAMVGSEVTLPVTGRRVPVMEMAQRSGGLGDTLSLIAPAFNAADFAYARASGLEVPPLYGADGTIDERIDDFGGMPIETARARILEIARGQGTLCGRFSHVTARAIHVACGAAVRPAVRHVWLVRGQRLGEAAERLMVDSGARFNHPAWQYSYRRSLAATTRPPTSGDAWWEGAPAASFSTLGSAVDAVISDVSCVGPRIPAAHCRICGATQVGMDLPTTCSECGGMLEPDSDVLCPSFSSALWTIAMAASRARPAKVDCAVLGCDLLETWVPTAELVARSLYGQTAFQHMIVHGAVHHRPGHRQPTHEVNAERALRRWGGDAIRAAVFTAMADHEGAHDVQLDGTVLERGARLVAELRAGLAAVEVGDDCDVGQGAQLLRVEREVTRAMEGYHLGWAYRLVSSFVTKRLSGCVRLSGARFEAVLSMLKPFHPLLVAEVAAAHTT